jgi:carboxyl-terminal processing protease
MWWMCAVALAQEPVLDVYTTLSKEYDAKILETAAIDGMLEAIDRERGVEGSRVLSTSEYQAYQRWLTGQRDGYGMRIQMIPGRGMLVEYVMASSPAEQGGIQIGDLITTINTRTLAGMSPQSMLHVLEGEGVERLTLDVVRQGQIHQFSLKKGGFQIPQVDGSTPVQVQFFGRDVHEEIATKLIDLEQEVVLDLRDNTGGLWTEAIATLDLFFPAKTVVAYRQNVDGTTIPILAQQEPIYTKPLVVLINEQTSGPAELVALTLQENQRATIIGERSKGQNLDYQIQQLNADSVLMLADTHILSSQRRTWYHTGVVPNVSVSSQYSYRGEDRQLQTAIQLVNTTP